MSDFFDEHFKIIVVDVGAALAGAEVTPDDPAQQPLADVSTRILHEILDRLGPAGGTAVSDAKPRKVRCPYCQKRVALTSTGKLYAHNDPTTKRPCGRSGGRPN